MSKNTLLYTMPKVTSLANKENILPLSKTRKAKTSSRDERQQEDDDQQEEEPLADMREVKRSKSINISSSKQDKKTRRIVEEAEERQPKSSSSDSASLRRLKSLENDNDDAAAMSGEQERKSKREQILEEKLALITNERDQVQSQFDDLREMRQTEPERLLADWKKLANQRDMQAEEYIKKLKNQLQSAQSKRESTMSSSSDGALFRHAKDGVDDDNAISWPAREKKLTQELAKLKQELAASSLALKSRAGQGMTNIGLGDEKAIRRLYEDLTGLVINKVEPAIHREKDYFRSFHAIFASDGYYNLEMKLEESESTFSTSEAHQTREDLVYVPAMNPDRDAEIIASGKLPAYLTESLRFERSSAVRFMSTLHKRLDKSVKK